MQYKKSLKAKLTLLVWLVLILILSLIPVNTEVKELIPYQDKYIHIFMYLVLALFMMNCFVKIGFKQVFVTIIFGIIYGSAIEVLQGLLNTGRYFDYFDIIANIIGSLTGSLLFYRFYKK